MKDVLDFKTTLIITSLGLDGSLSSAVSSYTDNYIASILYSRGESSKEMFKTEFSGWYTVKIYNMK